MRETELKFSVHPSFLLPQELTSNDSLRVEELPSQELRATYYDVEDLRLARSGVTLRYRTGDEGGAVWTVKLPIKDSKVDRNEIDLSSEPHEIPDEAIDLVTGYLRSGRLDPVATLVTVRRRWRIETQTGNPLALLSDDEVSLLDQERVNARFRELELESLGVELTELEEIVAALRASGAMPSEPIPKAVRALGPRATGAPDVVIPEVTDPETPATVVIQAAFARSTLRLIEHDAPARIGDPEGVHQMRVAARRLRSDLRTFASLVEPEWAERLRTELQWLGDGLGRVRDLDVLQTRLKARSDGLGDDLKPLFHVLEQEEEAARAAMLQALRTDRYKALLDGLVTASRAPRTTSSAALPANDVMTPMVAAAWRRLRKAAGKVGKKDDAADLHKVRIRAKRTRYAAETVAALGGDVGKRAVELAAGAEALQDVLGEHQDSVVATEAVTRVATKEADDPSLTIASGRLIERESQAADEARSRWRKVWSKLDGKKTTKWLKNSTKKR